MDDNRKLYLVKVLGLAALYYGAAKLGLSLAFATESVTAVWAPTGISLAALILFGYRLWPGVALGAFLANAWTGVPIYTVLGITAGNTLEALVGAYLLVEVARFRPSLERVSDVLWLVLLGALVSTTVSATIGTASLLLGDEIEPSMFGFTWRTWWLGDMGGDLIVAPLLLAAVTHWPYGGLPGRLSEAVGLGLLVLGLSVVVFTNDDPITFLLIPAPILAAFRFRQLGAVGAVLLIAAFAIPFTDAGHGPFAGHPPDDRLVLATALLGVSSLSALIVAAIMSERERAESSVRAIADTLQESLLAPRLPPIPGVEAAIDFRPAGESGTVVGGDFYDIIETGRDSFGVVIGDALGKGPMAAADTALARYTLRAATLHETRPSRLLAILNESMLRHAPHHPCTAAYVQLDLKNPGAALTASIGGHPKPLILRLDGTVEPLGEAALPLGVNPDVNLREHRAELHPGEALVLYTDGLTDAYAPQRVVSAINLAEALRPQAGADARRILAAALQIARPEVDRDPRDDILVLVLRLVPDGTRLR